MELKKIVKYFPIAALLLVIVLTAGCTKEAPQNTTVAPQVPEQPEYNAARLVYFKSIDVTFLKHTFNTSDGIITVISKAWGEVYPIEFDPKEERILKINKIVINTTDAWDRDLFDYFVISFPNLGKRVDLTTLDANDTYVFVFDEPIVINRNETDKLKIEYEATVAGDIPDSLDETVVGYIVFYDVLRGETGKSEIIIHIAHG